MHPLLEAPMAGLVRRKPLRLHHIIVKCTIIFTRLTIYTLHKINVNDPTDPSPLPSEDFRDGTISVLDSFINLLLSRG